MSTVRSDFRLCPEVTFLVITSRISAYGYLASWNPFLIGIIFPFPGVNGKMQRSSFRLTFKSESFLSEISILLNFANKVIKVWRIRNDTKHPDDPCQRKRWWGFLLVRCDFQHIHSIFTCYITWIILLEKLLLYANSFIMPTFLNMTHLNR